MGHGDDAGLTVNQDDGHAIGRIHADDDALQPCHQCVYTLEGRLLLVDIQRAETLVDDGHTARMRLPRHDQVIEVNTQLHRQREPRVKHPQGIVTHIVTQVHARVGIAAIHLASCRREGLNALD